MDVDTSIDELIYNLVEVRNKNRPDLPKLTNLFKDGLAVVPPLDPSISPKRGRGRPPKYPRVISNVQVKPLRADLLVGETGLDSEENPLRCPGRGARDRIGPRLRKKGSVGDDYDRT